MKDDTRGLVYALIFGAVILLFVGILFVRSGILNAEPVVEVQPNNCYEETLYVITDEDYRPYSFYGPIGEFSGHDVELINEIANELEMNLDLRFMQWDEAIAATDAGEADVLMTCDYSDSFEGTAQFLKSNPVSVDDFIVYSKRKISSVDELYSTSIGVMRDGNVVPQVKMLDLLQNCTQFEDNRQAMQALETCQVDCVIMRSTVGSELLKELGYSDISGYVSIGRSYMCFDIYDRGDGLAQKINDAIFKMKADGRIADLHEKWLTTFVAPYSLTEVLSLNPWIVVLFVVAVVAIISLIMRDMQRRRRSAEERNRYDSIVENFTRNYNLAYQVDLSDDSFQVLKEEAGFIGRELNFKVFSDVIAFFLNDVVFEVDREFVERELDYETIREKIAKNKRYSIEYRAFIDGVTIWNEMTVSALDEKHTAFGFAAKNKEIILNRLQLAQGEDYFDIYSVDVDTGLFTVLKRTGRFDAGEEGSSAPYGAMMQHFASAFEGETRDFFLQMADLDNVRNEFAVENKRTYSYQSSIGGVRSWVQITSYVVARHEDGSLAVFTLGFGVLDTLGADRQELQMQLQDALSMAESANRAKTAFLNNMSHDIRTPMNAIIGYTGLATAHIDNREQVQDYLGKIGQSSDHLLSLINDVLDMSRIESGKMNLDEKEESLPDIVGALRDIVQADMRAKQHDFTIDMGNVRDEIVVCDRLRLNQVLLNILSNAIKYTPEGGTISLRIVEKAATPNGYATYEFRIEDNGMGMDGEYLKTIFDPFTRVKSSTVSGIQGTGLGMAITKNIIDMMGGTIDIQSAPGEGTTVTIEFDFELGDERAESGQESGSSGDAMATSDERGEGTGDGDGGPQAAGAEESACKRDFTGKRVLLVEDNEFNREIATELLEDYGFIVDGAEDGDIAVEMFAAAESGTYACVLMDVQMPRMNGYEATRRIRAMGENNAKTTPIIAMTANAFEEDRRAALEAGMDEHIAKPIDVAKLEETLARFV